MNINVTGEEIIPVFSKNISSIIEINKTYTLGRITPLQLLKPSRLDVVAKYIYAQAQVNSTNCDFFEELYLEHIKAFNGFVEADGTGKVGRNRFLEEFNGLISSMEGVGFSKDYPIPISADGILLDGAHRVGGAMALKEDVVGVRFDVSGPNYDYKFFKSRGLQQKYLDALALEYAKLKPNTRVVLIWPAANGRQEEIERILENYGDIVCYKEVLLSPVGANNITTVAYRGEDWVGSRKDGYSGVANKANQCFSVPGPLRVFMLESEKDLIGMKEEIRGVFSIGKHSVHINDTYDETIELAQCLFNKNSIELLNTMVYRSLSWFERLFAHYEQWIVKSGLNANDFCIDGSGSLAAFGIRDVRDLDYLYHGKKVLNSGFKEIGCHNDENLHINLSHEDIIYNPSNHFYYGGHKFVSLKLLRLSKTRRAEIKDIEDVESIDAVLKGRVVSVSLIEKIKRLSSPSFVKAKVKMLLLKIRYFLTLARQWVGGRI